MFGNVQYIPYICTYKRYIFNKLKEIKMKNATNATKKQANTYRVYDSMGRATDIAITASNKAEALATLKQQVMNKEVTLPGSCFILRRSYTGGVRG